MSVSVVTGGTEGFSVSFSYVGDLSVPSVAAEPIIKDWHLAPATQHLAREIGRRSAGGGVAVRRQLHRVARHLQDRAVR